LEYFGYSKKEAKNPSQEEQALVLNPKVVFAVRYPLKIKI
jgi:hypothetical protein